MNRIFSAFGLVLIVLFSSCDKDSVQSTCATDIDPAFCEPDIVTIDSLRSTRNVLIVGVDGMRSDVITQSSTPFLYGKSIGISSFYNNEHLAEDFTISGPNWSSILTGVHYCKHGVVTNGFDNPNYAEYPHFFSYIEAARPNTNTVSIVNWLPINTELAEGVADYAPTLPITDDAVAQEAASLLQQTSPFVSDVMFLHLDQMDAAGHNYGFSNDIQEYVESAATIDSLLLNLFSIITQKRNQGEEWLFVVVSDHGGFGTGHGGGQGNPEVEQTILLIEELNSRFNQDQETSQVDIVPTVLDYLGIESSRLNCTTDGRSLLN